MATEWITGHCQKCHAKWPRRVTSIPNSKKLEVYGHVPAYIFVCKKCWEKFRPKKSMMKKDEEKKPIRRKIEGWAKKVDDPMWTEQCHICGEEAVLMWDEGRFRKLCPRCYEWHYGSYHNKWKKTQDGVRVWWRDDYIRPIDVDPKPRKKRVASRVMEKPLVLNFCGPRKIEW